MELKDRVCIVTGAARGIGLVVAQRLLAEGARVALWDVAKDLEDIAASLDPGKTAAKAWLVDVSDENRVREAAAQVQSLFGGIDVLVNCAGILIHKPIEVMTLQDFEAEIRINLTGTFLACKYVVPYMKKRGKGKIVNISSLGGRTGRPGVGVNYAASKAGVVGMTQTLAKELGPAGIYANAIAPGPIMTELTKQVGPEVFAKWNVGRALNKDGLPEDVADAVVFLASDRSDWITGITLDINAGIFIP
ncbi:MAG: 3-oxoacyl-ACP reductase family protein [Desulfatirhabdiaceae bacterium]|nr:3-oxoacyl-ACP reductase family protein [Desulfatirhabdiaceae bacterium]